MNKHPKYTMEHYKYDLPVGMMIEASKRINLLIVKIDQDTWEVVESDDSIQVGDKVTVGTYRKIKLKESKA